MEDVECNTIYSITFNPSEQDRSLPLLSKLYRQRLRPLPDISIDMYPEFAKRSLRMHYHGIVKFSSLRGIVCFYLWLESQQVNMVYELDTIKDKVIWDKYIHKQWHQFQTIYEPDEIKISYERSMPGLTKAMLKLLYKKPYGEC